MSTPPDTFVPATTAGVKRAGARSRTTGEASRGGGPLVGVPLDLPSRRSVPAQVADSLTEAVLTGRYRPGSTLPPERELAAHLGINRTSLRHAIARLEQAGLVESRQGIGTVVRDPLQATDPALVLRALVTAGPELVAEVLEVRRVLGGLAGRLAAERATELDLVKLDEHFEAARATAPGDAAALQAVELAFFSCLVDATANRPLLVMMRWLEELYGATAPLFSAAFTDPRPVLADLRRVRTAVAGRRPDDAEDAVRRYADRSGRRLLAAVKRPSP